MPLQEITLTFRNFESKDSSHGPSPHRSERCTVTVARANVQHDHPEPKNLLGEASPLILKAARQKRTIETTFRDGSHEPNLPA
jgi:hypothetical protein